MTDKDENCTVTDFTRDHWLYVYQQVVKQGNRDRNLIVMGERLMQAGLATVDEIEVWKGATLKPRS